MELKQEAMRFVNAHRDACYGQFVVDDLMSRGATQEESVEILKELYSEGMIYWVNINEEPNWDVVLDEMVMITPEGYEAEDYKDIW